MLAGAQRSCDGYYGQGGNSGGGGASSSFDGPSVPTDDSGTGIGDVFESVGEVEEFAIPLIVLACLVSEDLTVIAVGGGGIPVIENEDGELVGTSAVIDKDFASGLLANDLGAELLLISTAVEKVALNFNTPEQSEVSPARAGTVSNEALEAKLEEISETSS